MKLEGSLDAFSLPDVFQLLSLTKKSGGLHLANGQVSGAVYFTQGAVTGAVSDEARQGLARRLVGMGVVDDAALRRAVDRSAAESIGVARAVLESGSVDADAVRALATEQTVDAVFDLLRWPNGDFSFTVDEPNPDDVGISMASEQVVTEANARRETWDGVSKVIPSPDVILTMPVVLVDNPSVTREEWALLALVDGTRTVGDLVELSGAGQYGVVAALASLVQRGLLTLHDEDAADHVTVVRRRQVLLSTLEGAYPQIPQETTAEVANSTSIVAPLVADPAGYPPQSNQEAAPLLVASVSPSVASPALAPQQSPEPDPLRSAPPQPDVAQPYEHAARYVGAHLPADVVPSRPEPFLPKRSVDHPEPEPGITRVGFPAPGTPVAVTTATPAPAPEQTRVLEAAIPTPEQPQPGIQPGTTQPVMTQPVMTQPVMTQPVMTQPPLPSGGTALPRSIPGSLAAGGGAAPAVQPAVSGAIERDPSVNRSLLLRLIAGVRGL